MNDDQVKGDFLKPFVALLHSIEWRTPFMISLIIFQFLWLFIVIASLYSKKLRIPIAIICAMLSYSTDHMNTYLSEHFQQFGLTRNVFDPSGLFGFIFMALPMTFYVFLFVLSYLFELFIMMKKILRLKKEIRTRKNKLLRETEE